LKIAVLLDYPDDATPEFSAGMKLHGGKVEAVQFGDGDGLAGSTPEGISEVRLRSLGGALLIGRRRQAAT